MAREAAMRENGLPPIFISWFNTSPNFLSYTSHCKNFHVAGSGKNNDFARGIVLRKSNKWDATADVLRHEKRQWELKECERMPRSYEKKDDRYWESDIRENRKKRKRVSVEQQINEASVENQTNTDISSPCSGPIPQAPLTANLSTGTSINPSASTSTISSIVDFSRLNIH
jgi:hypothetical protein